MLEPPWPMGDGPRGVGGDTGGGASVQPAFLRWVRYIGRSRGDLHKHGWDRM
jgi:hypothetical protein